MREFLERLREAVGVDPPSGVQLAPGIDPKRLTNAARWASFGQEQPVLFIDNTVFGSGKAGVLLTSQALYYDDPKTRVALGEILEPPVFPEGVKQQGSLRTSRGEVKLPFILGDAEILRRVLLAIVSINRGTASPATPPLTGPIGELAQQFLRHDQVNLAPDLPRKKLRAAAASFTEWLDHATGERPIAFLDETALGKGDEGVLLTDRRLLAYTEASGKHVMIPYSAITGVSVKKGFMETKLEVSAAQFSAPIPLITCADAVEPLTLFLRGLLRLPPEQRWEPPVSHATAEDPSGAFGLLQALGAPDVRIPILLRFVGEMTRQGAMPPAVGADFVARIHMLHQTQAFGRGMVHGTRISPLHGPDFHYMLSTVFGDPTHVAATQGPPEAQRGSSGVTHTLDFALTRRPNAVGAGVSTAVGLAALALIGVGWVSTPKRNIQGVRVVATDLPCSTGFSALGMLSGRFGPLATMEPTVLGWLLDALDDLEAIFTFYRAAFGWQIAPAHLLQWGGELPGRVAQLLGPTDLSAFDVRCA
ncbi:MAG: hypothetical protein JNL79_03595 [Myxococcales bacterium]|nr:hypothetical protein [Myxococcales bacterium]